MSVQNQRVPLGEYSNIKLNRMPLLSSGNNTIQKFDRNKIPQLTDNLNENSQPIDLNTKLKTNSNPSTVASPANKNTQASILLNESPTNRILKTLIPDISLYNSTTSITSSNNNNNIATNKTTKDINDLHSSDKVKTNYTELSKRLQVRLQFAYFKLRTKQIDKSFSDLKHSMVNKNSQTINNFSKRNISSDSANKIIKESNKIRTKRRKLVVSHGNYKTPAKNHPKIIIDEVTSSDTIISTPSTMTNNTTTQTISADSIRTEILVPQIISTAETTTATTKTVVKNNDDTNTNKNMPIDINTLSPNNNTTLLDCHTTPIRDSLKQLSKTHVEHILPSTNSVSTQETPMRVKAAKSLIQLFSSISK